MKLRVGFLALIVACGGGTTTETARQPIEAPRPEPVEAPDTSPAPAEGRLPEGASPLRYSLALSIDPDLERFGGVATIDVNVASPRRVIWLHGQGLEVSSAIVRSGDDVMEAEWEGHEEESGFASLRLPRAVSGDVQFEIQYTAPFDRALGGIYKVEHAGHRYAFTQMEPLSARKAFPCFDEPQFKTPFDVTLRVQADHVAAANSRALRENVDGERKTVRFATTQPIPTYLFALAVGPLDVVEGTAIPASDVRETPLPFRGLAAHGRGPELAYTMEHTGAILAQLESYFGIAYPYDKLDVVAVPDFEAGAMENVGLVTFRDTILLIDPERTPTNRLRFWAYIMAHELAHMWFGNLVTMEWWDDLWLNEAFASWIEHTAVAGWREDYEADVELTEWVHRVYGRDSLASARAIRQPIVSTDDIHNAFDGITYGKGAGVLRMFESFVGPDSFREGIRAYLRAHRFGSATADNLLASLSEAAGRDVATPFRTFLTQPGLPMVSVELVCDDQGARARLRQSRYVPTGSSAERDVRWQIPVCVSSAGRGRRAEVSRACTLLEEEEGEIALGESCPAWIHPNPSAAGYYQFSLPSAQLSALQRNAARLSVTERLALADSVRAAFASSQADAAAAIETSLSLAGDSHHAVATANLGFLGSLLSFVETDEQRAKLRRRYARAYAADYRRLRWAPRGAREEAEEVRLRRGKVVGFMATTAEDPAARREGLRLGRAYLNADGEGVDSSAVSADLAEAAMIVAIQDGDASDFERAMSLLETTTDGQARRWLLKGIGATRDDAQALRAMNLALSEGVRVNEIFIPLSGQFAQRNRRAAAWAWLQANFDALVARLPPGYAGYLPTLMGGACSEDEASAVGSFFEGRMGELPGGPRNTAQTVEAIRLCAALVNAQGEGVRAVADAGR